ncbi:MAG: BON domain-containing protein [Actinomycetota bacterium]
MGTSAVVEKVRHAGEVVGPKAREIGEAVGPKVKQLGKTVAPKVKTARRRVGFWIAGEEPRKGRRWQAIAAAGIGAVAAFFLDPVSGKRRRSVTKDWVGARVRGMGRQTAQLGRGLGAWAVGFRERMEHAGDESPPGNDATLAHKVEGELFRDLDISPGQININAENGVVSLRGAVKTPSQIIEIEKRVWDISGVRGVENLLHLEGTPAPSQ